MSNKQCNFKRYLLIPDSGENEDQRVLPYCDCGQNILNKTNGRREGTKTRNNQTKKREITKLKIAEEKD